ncbi:C-type lectin domain family 17, member A [Amphibalanus amphitrite]|uniref:C-type lectin domain family 17, member A n=1 Tax=Amphibalanus amphitrite TaxID=1232801 RepID=A0A6A4VK46_AMPAM|nr:C-type lectin domain family 17, member A [Amphibalanus amphitrite]
MITGWRLPVAILAVLAGAVLAAPPSDPVTSVDGDTVVTSAADLGNTPAVDTPLDVEQRAIVKDVEADPVEQPADPALTSDERSSGWKVPGWPPSSSFQPLLQLSTDTLRQCTAQNGDGGSDRGSNNKPVLRAVGCTQAVLRDGQQTILGRLQHLQTALWQKVETLKELIEEDSGNGKDRWVVGDDPWKLDALEEIQRGVRDLVSWKKKEDGYLREFRQEVLSDTSMLKRGQRYILYKLYSLYGEVRSLSGKLCRCCRSCCGQYRPPKPCSRGEIFDGDRCRSCPRGFEAFDTRCLKLSSQKKSFDEAKRTCENDEAVLATLRSEDDEAIFELAGKSDRGEMWMGLQKDRFNNWVWQDGSPAEDDVDVSSLSSISLNNFRNDCAAASRKNRQNSVVDRPCREEKQFVCEFVPLESLELPEEGV